MMAKIEWKTKEEIEEEKNAPRPPTTEELQQQLDIAVLALMELGNLIMKGEG